MNQDDFRKLVVAAPASRLPAASTVATTSSGPSVKGAKGAPDDRGKERPKHQFRRGGGARGKDRGPRQGRDEYRDRAAERRDGSSAQEAEEALLRTMDYERSKLLGGDLAHTHLVKGLDFALLRRMKEEQLAAADDEFEAAVESLGDKTAGVVKSEKAALSTATATSVAVPSMGAGQELSAELAACCLSESARGIAAVALLTSEALRLAGFTTLGRTASNDVEVAATMQSCTRLLGTPSLPDDRFSGLRIAFEFSLGADTEAGIAGEAPTVLLRSREDAAIFGAADAPYPMMCRLDAATAGVLKAALAATAASGSSASRRQQQGGLSCAGPKAASRPSAVPTAISSTKPTGAKSALVAAAAPVAVAATAEGSDDDDDIFAGAGVYVKPLTAAEVAEAAAAAIAAANAAAATASALQAASRGADPVPAAASLGGASAPKVEGRAWPLAAAAATARHAAARGTGGSAALLLPSFGPRVTPPSGSSHGYEDEGDAALGPRSTALYSRTVVDEDNAPAAEADEEGEEGGCGFKRPGDASCGVAAAAAAAGHKRARDDERDAQRGGGGKGRPQAHAPAPAASEASSSSSSSSLAARMRVYDALGGDVAPARKQPSSSLADAAGAAGGAGEGHAAPRLQRGGAGGRRDVSAAFDRYDRDEGGSWAAKLRAGDDDEEGGDGSRQRKKARHESEFAKVQQIMRERYGDK